MKDKNDNIGLAKETSLLFLVKIFGAIIAFVLQIIINKFLGTELYGQLSKYLAIATVFITLINLGTNVGIVKKAATSISKEEDKRYIWFSINILIILTIIVFILSAILKKWLIEFFSFDIYIFVFLFTFSVSFALSNILTGFFQGKKKTLYANVMDIVCYNFLLIGGSIIISNLSKSLYSLLFIYVLSNFVVLIIKTFSAKKQLLTRNKTYIDFSFKIKENFDFALMCIPFCLSAFCLSAQSMLLKMILDKNMGSFDVGVFRILETYVSCMALFVSPFITLWPYMANAYKEDRMDDLKEKYSDSVSIIALLALPTTVSMLICSNEVYAIFGINAESISRSYASLFLMLVSGTVDAVIGPAGALLNMTKYGRLNLIITLLSAFFCLGLSVLLIPKYGLLGAAISTGISRIITNIMTAFLNYIKLKICPYSLRLLVLITTSVPLYYLGKLLYITINSSLLINIIIISIVEVFLFLIEFYFIYNRLSKKIVVSFIDKIKNMS